MIRYLLKVLVVSLIVYVIPVLGFSREIANEHRGAAGTDVSRISISVTKLAGNSKQQRIKKQTGVKKQPGGKKQTGAKKPPAKKPTIKEVPKSKRQLKPSAVKGKASPAKVHKPKVIRKN